MGAGIAAMEGMAITPENAQKVMAVTHGSCRFGQSWKREWAYPGALPIRQTPKSPGEKSLKLERAVSPETSLGSGFFSGSASLAEPCAMRYPPQGYDIFGCCEGSQSCMGGLL
jgi:hypothetical protein